MRPTEPCPTDPQWPSSLRASFGPYRLLAVCRLMGPKGFRFPSLPLPPHTLRGKLCNTDLSVLFVASACRAVKVQYFALMVETPVRLNRHEKLLLKRLDIRLLRTNALDRA